MTDNDSTNNKNGEKYDPSRRKFIKNTGILAGGVVGGSLLGGILTNQFQTKPDTPLKDTEAGSLQEARLFFSRKEDFNVLSAATERLFPEDEHGPGAIELGVPYFIDKQLNSSWGTNAKVYMKGPFSQTNFVREYEKKDRNQSEQGPNTSVLPDLPTPRYQTRLNRGELFLIGIRTMDKKSQEKYKTSFDKLEGDQQDDILTSFERDEVAMPGISSGTFFNLLLQLTIEGAYADPVYGGNKNMLGWKMKEYPGPRAAYINDIESEDFIEMDQMSLKDYQS